MHVVRDLIFILIGPGADVTSTSFCNKWGFKERSTTPGHAGISCLADCTDRKVRRQVPLGPQHLLPKFWSSLNVSRMTCSLKGWAADKAGRAVLSGRSLWVSFPFSPSMPASIPRCPSGPRCPPHLQPPLIHSPRMQLQPDSAWPSTWRACHHPPALDLPCPKLPVLSVA